MKTLKLRCKKIVELVPKTPYNFNANFHKPSHFPSSDNLWEKDKYWITMRWKEEILGLRFNNMGTIENPKLLVNIYSVHPLSDEYINPLIQEIRWRFNFDQDVSSFAKRYKSDKFLRIPIKKLKGMKPIAANSLYETIAIYFVLQNAPVRRSVQMLENLFGKFGYKVIFDKKALSAFWIPDDMQGATEEELRMLKIGYRAKFFKRISEEFTNGSAKELEIRKLPKDELRDKLLEFYGVGPATMEYLLFEDFYHLDALETIPPWEQKIMSKLLFNKKLVPTTKIINFFRKRYPNYEKLAFHYLWEDLFWQRKQKRIEWLEKEIRL